MVLRKGRGHLSNHAAPAGWKSLLPGARGASAVNSPYVTTASKRQVIPVCLLCMLEESHCSATSLFAELGWFPQVFLIFSEECWLRNQPVLSSSVGLNVYSTLELKTMLQRCFQCIMPHIPLIIPFWHNKVLHINVRSAEELFLSLTIWRFKNHHDLSQNQYTLHRYFGQIIWHTQCKFKMFLH